jgi:hypothetical protein
MNKFSNTNHHDDEEIEEDINYDNKFDKAIEVESEDDDFVESISKTF